MVTALAWVAVDRALGDDPHHPLASLVSRSLAGGLPPDKIREFVSSLPPVAGWTGEPVGSHVRAGTLTG